MSETKEVAIPESTYAALNDASFEEAKKLVGVYLRRDVHWPATYEPLSLHDIRRWAIYSIGDDNPLWADVEYGKRCRFGSNIAPPTIFYTIDSTIVAPGLPGIQWIHGGNDWEFVRPVRPGDTITAEARLIGMTEKTGRHVPRFFVQTGEVVFKNQRDERVARTTCDILRIPRKRSGGGLRGFDDRTETKQYTPQEIAEIAQAYESEQRRGPEPRYWEDVNEGDTLDPLVKGPLTLVDVIAFYAGRRTVYPPLKFAYAERKRHPANVYISPRTGIPVHPAAGHFDTEIAHEVGMPGAYDQGWMRINWLGHLVTNWMGDHAWLKRLNAKNRLPNLVGDLSWVKGVVSAKRERDHQYEVDVRVWVQNHRGEQTSEGLATIALPSRDPRSQLEPA